MEEIFVWFKSHILVRHTIINVLLILLLFLLRRFIFKLTHKSKKLTTKQKRQWDINAQSLITIVLIVGTILIWAEELRTVAISIVAVAAAFVLAIKELITCFMGSFYKVSQDPFGLGDRIEVNGIRGDVIGRGLLSTTLQEVGPGDKSHQYTGRSVIIPNSLFLTQTVYNESFWENFVLHIFEIPIKVKNDWQKAEEIVLEVANETTKDYMEKASKTVRKCLSKKHLEIPQLTPRVHIRPIDGDKLVLMVRVTAPAREKGRIEQEIIRQFMKKFY